MTLEEFLQNYGGNACISIDGYCEEANYDFWTDVKDREIKNWNIIGGGMDKVELWINLEK